MTLAFQGGVEHSDSTGNNDVIGPGDVQWMTAGRGIIHEEFHASSFAKTGGKFEMCQIWVNLPKKHKMHAPRYQPITATMIPTVPLKSIATGESCGSGATARVIAGSINGKAGPAQTFSPIEMWDISLPTPDDPVELTLPVGHTAIVFVRAGGVKVGVKSDDQRVLGPQAVALLGASGTQIRLSATEAGTQLIILGGEPINEPIAAQGPFVMNTMEEIRQANVDFRAGRMGT